MLNDKDIELLIERHGRRSTQVLNALAKLYPTFEVLTGTEIGQTLLEEDIQRLDQLFQKIYQEQDTVQERAEFRYLKDIRIPRIIQKLETYLNLKKEINNNG